MSARLLQLVTDATPQTPELDLSDRAVERSIEVRGGIYGKVPGQEGAQISATWKVSVSRGESIPHAELWLGHHGISNDEAWERGQMNNESLACLTTRDGRAIRAYGELLLELADLVEAEQ